MLCPLRNLEYVKLFYKNIKNTISTPHGFFLATGPTGSGKSTTLYALLTHLNNSERNIITMEDPVEYNIKGITQSQVNLAAGFTFQNGLRSLLRQDPDIIMIGEIRDNVTVNIAIEAALTGHLVLSTLHTSHSPGAITRLLDMNIESFLVNATISGILAQRLARTLCPKCKKEIKASDFVKNLAQKYGIKIEIMFKEMGCDDCHNIGHKGRIGIFEFLTLSDKLRAIISNTETHSKIYKQALTDGIETLEHDGLLKVKDGLISLEEFVTAVGIWH